MFDDLAIMRKTLIVLDLHVAASFEAEGAGMTEPKQWSNLYGEGGSRKNEQLSYFL